MVKDEKYYRELSEAYLFELEQTKNDTIKISIAMGVMIVLESELIVFENKILDNGEKRGQTEKSKEQWDRLNLLRNSIEHFQGIASKNSLLRERLKYEAELRWKAEIQLKAVSEELEQLKQAISLHEEE